MSQRDMETMRKFLERSRQEVQLIRELKFGPAIDGKLQKMEERFSRNLNLLQEEKDRQKVEEQRHGFVFGTMIWVMMLIVVLVGLNRQKKRDKEKKDRAW